MTPTVPDVAFLLVVLVSGGASTLVLRQAIVDGDTDRARLHRAVAQTACVVVGLVVLAGPARLVPPLRAGVGFAALNGALGGIAFVLFSKGLETVEASTGKPALVLSMVVAATLGVAVLGEALTAEKLGGVVAAGAAVYLLTSGD